jgi:hypothetical protein
MALRGKKAKEIQAESRLKLLLFGDWKVGKTTAAINFPCPYLIDTEKGAIHKSYTDILEKNNGSSFQTTDYDEMMTEIKELATTNHEHKTLVIDSLTVIYNDLLDKSSSSLANSTDETGTAFGRHKLAPDRKMKRLFNWLTNLDMNIIITCQAKPRWVKEGKELVEAGMTFDGYSKAPFFFDLILELQKQGDTRYAVVRGSRFQECFKDNERFKFSYEEIANRFGKDKLEKNTTSLKLATAEQIKEVKRLIDLLKVPEETCEKWLEHAKSESFEEMQEEHLIKIIEFLNLKIKGVA